MYKLKVKNGFVECLLKAGKEYVRQELPVVEAQKIIDDGNKVESDREDYPICINNEWYFKGEKEVEEVKEEKTKAKKNKDK